MGRTLSMANLDFTASAIASTSVISSVVSLPIPFILGWVSDRLGRKSMMVICYGLYALCGLMLAISTSFWHFAVAMILMRFGFVSITVGAAFVTDLVEPKSLGRGVSLFQCAGWIATTMAYPVNSRHACFMQISFLSNSFWRRLPEQCCRGTNGDAFGCRILRCILGSPLAPLHECESAVGIRVPA